jgi:hypothetical protein
VLDNLTDKIVPWQSTDYRWMKIQSVEDARVWTQVETPGASRDRSKPNGPSHPRLPPKKQS